MTNSKIFAPHLLDTAEMLMEHASLAGSARLVEGARDFAFLTNSRISAIAIHRIDFATPNGLPFGKLFTNRGDATRGSYSNLDKDKQFLFTSHAIVKLKRERRGRGWGDSHVQRQAKTIKGMVQSMRKNDTKISEESITAFLCADLWQTFREPVQGVSEANLSMPRGVLLPLVRSFLNLDKFTVMQHEPQIKAAYAKFLEDNKAYATACENMMLFARGATIIGMESCNGGPLYIAQVRVKGRSNVAEVLGKRVIEFITPLVRHEELPEEFCGKAAICKAHLPGVNQRVNAAHPFGMSVQTDHYYEDVDVLTESSSHMFWTVIPADIPEEAQSVFSVG